MKRLNHLLLILAFMLFTPAIHAAYLQNIPLSLTQPDGDTLRCFASGDEYFNYLHDKDGYTIIQDPSTGYYVYAVLKGNDLVASAHIAGRVNPASVGLRPGILITDEQWMQKRVSRQAKVKQRRKSNNTTQINKGTINNIVIFIRFKGDAEFSRSYNQINGIFNDKQRDEASVYNYFRTVSYNQLTVNSFLYPNPVQSNTILSFEDTHPRGYYSLQTETNPDGYTPGGAYERSVALFKNAINHVKDQISENINLDYDDNGMIDNVCFVLKGDAVPGSSILWPYQGSISRENVVINGKRVGTYNVNIENMLQASVLCHEFMHTLGFPDLYVYNQAYDKPVGPWDIMASTTNIPQQAGAYTKWKYGNWVDEPILIDKPGTYTINALHSSEKNIAYQIPTKDPNQIFVIEYRRRGNYGDGSFTDMMIPSDGLLVYLIQKTGFGNYFGNTEVYIFRPDGKPGTNGGGALYYAGFGVGSRNAFNPDTNPQPCLNNGTQIEDLYISDIKLSGNQATFVYGKTPEHAPHNFRINSVQQTAIDLEWELNQNREVLLITDTKPITDSPEPGVNYTAGSTLPKGAQVIYTGTGTSFNHNSLLENTEYYYKIFTKMENTSDWSFGVSKNALTIGRIISAFPYIENFDSSVNLPEGYFSRKLIGDKDWLISTGTRNYCNTCTDYAGVNAAQSGNNNLNFYDNAQRVRPYKAILVLPTFDLSDVQSAKLDFYYTNADWAGTQDNLTIYYRTAPNLPWKMLAEHNSDIRQWTHATHSLPNPSGTYQLAFEGESKYGFGSTIDDIQVNVQKTPTNILQPNAGNFTVYTHRNRIYIRDVGNSQASIRITDLTGRSVYNGAITGSTAVISPDVPTGFYIVHLLLQGAAPSLHKVYLTANE